MTNKTMLSKFAISEAVLHGKSALSKHGPHGTSVFTTVYYCGFQSLDTIPFRQAALLEIYLLSLPVTLEGVVGWTLAC